MKTTFKIILAILLIGLFLYAVKLGGFFAPKAVTTTPVAASVSRTISSVSIPATLNKIESGIQKIATLIAPSVTSVNEVPIPSTTNTTAGPLTSSGIIADTNAERATASVPALTESAELDASATVKAKDILARQYFEHTAPDGKTVTDLVEAEGYTYIKIGENLALGDFANDQAVVTAWMNSPEHKANMLDPDFTDIGVGVAYGMYQGSLVSVAVQHFGRPSSSCPTISATLKQQVLDGQDNLTQLSAALAQLKTEISQGTAQGDPNLSTKIQVYNQGVSTYNADYDQVSSLRSSYNAEVEAYNACIASAP